MKLTVFGATGGVGRRLVELAVDEGHEVTAYARSPQKVPRASDVRIVAGELDDPAAIRRAIEGADAVLSTLGPRENTAAQVEVFGTALENITRAMEEHDVARLVSIAGAGLLMPGDTVDFPRKAVRFVMGLVAKHMLASKEREYEVIKQTELDWVLVRPPRIVEGPPTGQYEVRPDKPPGMKITQGDVAHFMLQCVSGDEWVKKGPLPAAV